MFDIPTTPPHAAACTTTANGTPMPFCITDVSACWVATEGDGLECAHSDSGDGSPALSELVYRVLRLVGGAGIELNTQDHADETGYIAQLDTYSDHRQLAVRSGVRHEPSWPSHDLTLSEITWHYLQQTCDISQYTARQPARSPKVKCSCPCNCS